jgi:type II secretory pathway predicted ATPase ExeA
MTIKHQRQLKVANIENPEGETRLELLGLSCALDVTMQALADHCAVSRTTMSRLATYNQWPVGRDRDELKALIREHLASAGASEEQLAVAFHAFTSRQKFAAPDMARRAQYRAEQAANAAQAALAGAPTKPTHDTHQEDDDMLLPKQSLSPDAKRHFKTFVNPFDGEVQSDAQMFVGSEVGYVLESCWQCAITNSFMALVGESGAGKTTIVAHLEARIEREARHAILIKPHVLGMEENDNRGKTLKSADILAAIITALEPTATVPQTIEARATKAKKMLAASVEAGNSHLLMIEEGHSLPDATLKHLKRMHELRAGRKPLMGILLVAQPELEQRLHAGLRGGHLREVAQRCEVVKIMPLDGELGAYLEHRAKAAGRALSDFIAPDAVDAIRTRLIRTGPRVGGKADAKSFTYPLAVGNFLTRAMNEAASLGVPVVTRDVVQGI